MSDLHDISAASSCCRAPLTDQQPDSQPGYRNSFDLSQYSFEDGSGGLDDLKPVLETVYSTVLPVPSI